MSNIPAIAASEFLMSRETDVGGTQVSLSPNGERQTVETPVAAVAACTSCKAQGAVVFCFTPGCPAPKLMQPLKGLQPLPGTLWQHYRGDQYRVLGACRLEATNEPGVIYRRADNDLDTIWVRSVADWHARVSDDIPRRFMLVGV